MQNRIPLTLLAALLAIAPLAAAQDEKPAGNQTEPSDGGNAWVEDCPPDMMCAYSHHGADADCKTEENATPEACMDRPTSDADCGGEVCAYDGGAPRGSCMDGRECDTSGCPECQTLTGGSGGDAEAAPIRADAGTETASAGGNQVPGLALAGAVGALAVAGLLLRRR